MDFIKELDKIYTLEERVYELVGDRIHQYYRVLVDISHKDIDEIKRTIEVCKECNVYLTMQNYEIGLVFPF